MHPNDPKAVAQQIKMPRDNRIMEITIPVAHDFICPWCWVALLQAKRLENEFGAKIEWLGYELFPTDLEWPDWAPGPEPPANKPPTPSRFDFLLAADDIEMPTAERPKKMRTFNAHEAVEYAKTEGVGNELIEVLYRALWERGEEINDLDVLRRLAAGVVKNVDALIQAAASDQFRDKIVKFDDDAYAIGVYNVPTFYIGGKPYAEQPYSVLRKAVTAVLEQTPVGAAR